MTKSNKTFDSFFEGRVDNLLFIFIDIFVEILLLFVAFEGL